MCSKKYKPLTEKQYIRWQKAMNLGYKICRCHQLSERSFRYKGMQFPACARCTGILIGFNIVGPIVTIFYIWEYVCIITTCGPNVYR